MPKRKGSDGQSMPLVENPISRTFSIKGPRSTIEITLTLSPAQWAEYKVQWKALPPSGVVAECAGQVHLLRSGEGRFGDSGPTVRACSDNRFYAGPGNGNCPGHRFHKYQLYNVDDFKFSGKIKEVTL